MKLKILITAMLNVLLVCVCYSQSKDNSKQDRPQSNKALTAQSDNITIPSALFDSLSAESADYALLRAEHIELLAKLARRDKEIVRKEGVILDQMAQKFNFKRLDSLCEISNKQKDVLIAGYVKDYAKATSFSPWAITLNAGYGIAAEENIKFKPIASIGLSYTIIRFKRKKA